jgi:hypothetical protein
MASRAELWRQSKKARAAEWVAFNASRPDESFEAPADLAALAEAAATIGDYKLKGDAGYVLPEVSSQCLTTLGQHISSRCTLGVSLCIITWLCVQQSSSLFAMPFTDDHV